jgi:hypothetical protein
MNMNFILNNPLFDLITPINAVDTALLNNFYIPENGPSPSNASYWQPYSGLNNALRKQEGIKSNWAYRKFMTQNAVGIMNYNTTEAQQALGLPIRFHSADSIQQSFNSNSDLKKSFVERERVQARMVAPSL